MKTYYEFTMPWKGTVFAPFPGESAALSWADKEHNLGANGLQGPLSAWTSDMLRGHLQHPEIADEEVSVLDHTPEAGEFLLSFTGPCIRKSEF